MTEHSLMHGYGYGYNHGVGLDDLIISNQMANGHQNLGNQVHTASVNGIQETSDAARDGINATNQIGNINLQSTERNGGESRATTERAAGVVRDMINVTANQAARDHGTIVGEICDVRKEMSEGFGSTNLEMAKQHGAIQLEMCKQHADLAAKLAECCCKLEGEHAATRQLLQSQALDECRRRESDLQNEVNFLKFASKMGGPGNS